MSRIDQVPIEELEKRKKGTVRHGAEVRTSKCNPIKLFEYIIPFFSKGGRAWRWNR